MIGGAGEDERLKSVEKLKIDENMMWESTTDLPENLDESAAVTSNSNDFIGYVAGGWAKSGWTDKVWGLRRADLKWVEMPNRLRKSRRLHTMVNVAFGDGC